jgi:protein-disulfide isomerase-like protein with CxxC motif
VQPSTRVIDVTHFTDPGCPWAYSAWPAHTTLRWRYGEQLRWTLVMVGLTEDAGQYAARGYSPTRSAVGYGRFRRFGMPFQITPKARLSATSPACRAIVATRLAAPALEDAALRALQFAQFTTTGTLDDLETLRSALAGVEGLNADAVVGADRRSRGRGRLRQRGPHSRAPATRRGPSRSAENLPLRPDDGRGGCRDGRTPRRTQSGRRRGRAHHGHRRGTRRSQARGRRLAVGAGPGSSGPRMSPAAGRERRSSPSAWRE